MDLPVKLPWWPLLHCKNQPVALILCFSLSWPVLKPCGNSFLCSGHLISVSALSVRFCQKPVGNTSRVHRSDCSHACCSNWSSGFSLQSFWVKLLITVYYYSFCLLVLLIRSVFWYCYSFLTFFNFRQTFFADVSTLSPQKKKGLYVGIATVLLTANISSKNVLASLESLYPPSSHFVCWSSGISAEVIKKRFSGNFDPWN